MAKKVKKMEYQGFLLRFFAFLIDIAVLIIIYLVLGMIPVIGIIIASIAGIFYNLVFVGMHGATIGKKALGLVVVDEKGNYPIGLLKAFIREIVGKFLSTAVLLIGYLMMIWTDKKQGLHDYIAGTYVVKAK